MKKFLFRNVLYSFLLFVTAMVLSDNAVMAESGIVEVPIGSGNIIVNGVNTEIDAPAYISDEGNTMVSVRVIANAFGIDDDRIYYNPNNKEVGIWNDFYLIRLHMGGDTIKVATETKGFYNVLTKKIDNNAKVELVEGRTFLPFREIALMLHCSIDWNEENKTVVLKTLDEIANSKDEYILDEYYYETLNEYFDNYQMSEDDSPYKVWYYSEEEQAWIDKLWDENSGYDVLVAEEIVEEEIVEPQITSFDVYNKIIALKKQYPDGTRWTNENIYTPLTKYYSYVAGCAGFAHMLSDAAFGTLEERNSENFNNIRVGDILRINNNTHSVIVLSVENDIVTVAEGNYNNSVKWGRQLKYDDIKKNIDYIITRYPE